MRNTLSKDIEKQIASLQGIIEKHRCELSVESKKPLEQALEALKREHDAQEAIDFLNRARICAIVDEVVDSGKYR